VFLSSYCFSQTVVLEQKGNQLNPDKKYGPNLKRYSNLSFGYGWFYQKYTDKNYQINFPRSIQLTLSRRSKYKLSSLFAIGNEIGLAFKNINLKNNNTALLSPNINRINRLSIGGSIYWRTNFDKKRGNRLGYFLDLGAGLDYFYLNKAISELDLPSSSYGSIRISYTGLKELKPVDYFCFARIGAERVNVIFQFILNEQIKDPSKSTLIIKNLPTFKAGIEVNPKK
jgi:hypothetical protein